MTRRFAGACGLGMAGLGGSLLQNDFAVGRSRLWLTGGVNLFTFDRARAPRLFWLSTVANWLVLALIAIGSVAALILPGA